MYFIYFLHISLIVFFTSIYHFFIFSNMNIVNFHLDVHNLFIFISKSFHFMNIFSSLLLVILKPSKTSAKVLKYLSNKNFFIIHARNQKWLPGFLPLWEFFYDFFAISTISLISDSFLFQSALFKISSPNSITFSFAVSPFNSL